MARITDPNADPNDPNLYDPEQSRDTLLGGMNGGSGIQRTPTTQAHTFEYDPAHPDDTPPPPPPSTTPPSTTPPPPPPPPPGTTTTTPAHPPAGTPPIDWTRLTPDIMASMKTNRPDTQAWVGEMLNKGVGDPAAFVDAVNKIYGLPSGQGAQYFGPGTHGQGSAETIALPGGYFAHEDNDPSKPWHWVVNNEGAGGVTGGPSTTAAPDTPLDALSTQALMDEIKNLMGSSTEDPQLQGAVSAYDNQSERDTQHNRDALAEHFYASNNGGGLDSGGFDQAVRQNAEEGSIARSNFAGNLYAKDAAGRRQVLAQLLNMAQNKQLAGGSLGFLYAQLMAQMNRDALLTSLGGG